MASLFKAKLMIGLVLAVLSLGTLAGLFYLQYAIDNVERAGASGSEARVTLAVLGEDGRAIHLGSVRGNNLTALSALLAGANNGNYTVETREFPMGTYVHAINGRAADASGGWIYVVTRDDVETFGDRAANRFPLSNGDTLTWKWSTDAPEGAR